MPTRRCYKLLVGQPRLSGDSTSMTESSLYMLILSLMLSTAAVQSCRTEFDSVQDRALVSQYVVVGRIDAVRPPSTSGGAQVARVTVLKVLKDGGGSSRAGITGVLTVDSTAQLEVLGFTDRSASQPKECISAVTADSSYFLFFNTSADGPAPYRSVKLAARYSKKEEDALSDAICTTCASVPRVRARKTTEAGAGSLDVVLTCTVESAQQVRIGWYKAGRDLAQNVRFQLQRKENRKRKATVLMARLKEPQPSDAGEYTCIAKNALGSSSASLRLSAASFPPGPTATSLWTTVMPTPRTVATSAEAYATSSSSSWALTSQAEAVRSSHNGTLRPSDSSVTTAMATSAEATTAGIDLSTVRSHYVGCTDKDTRYCLHGGICLMKPDGRDRHCRCLSQHTGARCEEKLTQWTFRPPAEVSPHVGDVKNDVIAALATALGFVLVAVCISKLVCGKQPCLEWRPCRNARDSLNMANTSASVPLLLAHSKRRPPAADAEQNGGVCERRCSAAVSDGLPPEQLHLLQRPLPSPLSMEPSKARQIADQACQTEAVVSTTLPFCTGCERTVHLTIEEPAPAADGPETLRVVLPCVCCCSSSCGDGCESTVTPEDIGRQTRTRSLAFVPGDTKGHVVRSSEEVTPTENDVLKASCDHHCISRRGSGGGGLAPAAPAAATVPAV